MSATTHFVVFCLDDRRYALPLDVVECVVRAVEFTPLPNAPAIVLGVINMAGRLLPVLNLRQRFGLPEREYGPDDQLLIARMAQRSVALVVDHTQGVIERPDAEITGAAQLVPGLEHIQGVVKCGDDLALILDLESALILSEARALDDAISREVAHEM